MPKTSVSMQEFNRELTKFSKRLIPTILRDTRQAVIRESYTRILMRTPVLTGRARRNWNLSFSSPNTETTEEVAGVAITGAPITGEEKARLNAILNNIGMGGTNSAIFISNGLPYIKWLEDGNSMKAPNGIVEGAILGALEVLSSKGIAFKI